MSYSNIGPAQAPERTHLPTSCEFFLIDQITCSLNFLEEFHLLFHLQKEFRRYHIKNGDRRVKHKCGEFFNFRNHILI